MSLDLGQPHWCACGCNAPIRPGMYVYQIGRLRYAMGCVHKVFIDGPIHLVSMDVIDEKILNSPAVPLDPAIPVEAAPSPPKG